MDTGLQTCLCTSFKVPQLLSSLLFCLSAHPTLHTLSKEAFGRKDEGAHRLLYPWVLFPKSEHAYICKKFQFSTPQILSIVLFSKSEISVHAVVSARILPDIVLPWNPELSFLHT